jgi:hypothetical protein
MKTLKVEAVYQAASETFEDATAHLPHCIDEVYNGKRLQSALGYISLRAVRGSTRPADDQNGSLILSTARGALQSRVPISCRLAARRHVVDALLELIGNTLLVPENAQALRFGNAYGDVKRRRLAVMLMVPSIGELVSRFR